ncbi:MAG: glycosyltransferase [Sedimentisphaerales bacterium]|nr:glycosyltransferase [Sedimentisphaerales bacterium]
MTVRVLHVIDHLGYGGAPLVVKNVVERMPVGEIESIVCALRPNARAIEIDAEVVTLASRKYSLAAIGAIARLCREHRIDVVHAHLQKAVMSSLLAAPRLASALVLHEHGPVFRHGTGCVYRLCLRLLGARAGTIIANSQATKTAVQRALAGSDVPVVVVPNFVDLEQFDPNRYDRRIVRRKLGFANDACVVGFVGRLDRAKGADRLIEAAACLRDEPHAYRFFLVGEGSERRHLEEQIRRLALEQTVTLAGLSEKPAEVMSAFDLAVVPSRREAFGIAALELMRMRVPVIVSPVGGLPELVRDGRTGIILEYPAPTHIADAIRRLRADPALRKSLADRGFEYSCTVDANAAVAQIVGVYENVLRARKEDGATHA